MPSFATIGTLASCSAGKYIWYDKLPTAHPHSNDHLIDTDDSVDVCVLSHEDMSVLKQKLRHDGRVSVPIIGDVEVRGKRPSARRAEIEARLKDSFVSPSVTNQGPAASFRLRAGDLVVVE